MRVILVRHGETEENVTDTLQGHRFGTLTPRGRAQIERLAQHLASEAFTHILSSDLVRARETTERIALHHPGPPVRYLPAFRERYLADFEGRPRAELDQFFAEALGDPLVVAPPGAESVAAVRERAVSAWNDIVLHHPTDSVVLVSAHGLFNRALLAWLLGKPLSATYELEQDNACINRITVHHNSSWSVEEVNAVGHLGSELHSRRGRTHY